MKKRNPKQIGTILYDCIPQHGPCPNNCNQCYYNECFYAGHEPLIPEPRDVAGGIVRMNSGHDSNLEKDLVLETAKQYKDVFFNTSIQHKKLVEASFAEPYVLTVNPKEESKSPFDTPGFGIAKSLMFVRFRTSATNIDYVLECAVTWAKRYIPVVLTLMRYRTRDDIPKGHESSYENKLHVEHDWWVPTASFWHTVTSRSKFQSNRMIHTCGSYESHLCKDCGLCECYYRITKKRLEENG